MKIYAFTTPEVPHDIRNRQMVVKYDYKFKNYIVYCHLDDEEALFYALKNSTFEEVPMETMTKICQVFKMGNPFLDPTVIPNPEVQIDI